MGEDGLNERNNQQLTPAGLGVKVGFCVCLVVNNQTTDSECVFISNVTCLHENVVLGGDLCSDSGF